MKLSNLSINKTVLLNFILIICSFVIFPLILNLIGVSLQFENINILGTFLFISLIIISIFDIGFLIIKKKNYYLLSITNMIFSIFLFSLMMYSFLNNIYEVVYVMNYSNSTLPLIYKIVMIWAGEDGSIMTWILFNSLFINFYRIKNQNKEDLIFIRSVIISLTISTVFLVILFYLNPFEIDPTPIWPSGNLTGSLDLLLSPFMIWHPFFTFIAYAVFLVPFTIIIAETITRKTKLVNSYQQDFYDFSLKFGWLVLSLSIGLGAYWAKIALNWGRYWGWDPVETVSLVPWFFITAFFHTKVFQKKNPLLIKLNIILIFLSVIFSTLITRTGGISPLHSFAAGAELVIWLVIVGIILISLSLYNIYIILDYLFEEYRKTKLFFDYLSYIFLISLAFVCIFGLFIPPLTLLLSNFFTIDIIAIGPDYFILTTFILAIGLAITLIFCSLWEYYEIKRIIFALFIGISIFSALSFLIFFISGIWINPIMIIYFIAIFASLLKLFKNFNVKKGAKYFFRLNSKTIIHLGISFILAGFLILPSFEIFQDIFFITGFLFLMVGIIPSILMVFFIKK